LSDEGWNRSGMDAWLPPPDGGRDPGHGATLQELRGARSHDELSGEVARLVRDEQESTRRIGRLKAALRALLDDLKCRLKTQEPLAKALRDLPSVLREAEEALED